MALTKVTYSMIEGPFLNVNDFGTGTSAVTAAMQYAVANDQIVLFSESATINIPTDCATLQLALDHANCVQGTLLTLNIESGHQLTTGFSIANGDYSRFLITSVDAVVSVNGSYAGTQLFVMSSCLAPTFDILVDGGSTIDQCYRYLGCTGELLAGAGAKNFTGRGLYASSSMISAGQTVWENNEELFFTNGSGLSMGGSSFTGHTINGILLAEGASGGCGGSTFTNCEIGIHCKDGSMLDAEDVVITGSDSYAVRVDGATINLNDAQLLLCNSRAIDIVNGIVTASPVTMTGAPTAIEAVLNRGGNCNIGSATISGFGSGYLGTSASTGSVSASTITGNGSGTGVGVSYGAVCDAHDATITGNAAQRDLSIATGSFISANGVTTTNSISPGVPNVSDTIVGAFNTVTSNRGIIWN